LSQQEFRDGSEIFVIDGKYEGLFATIIKVLNDSLFSVRIGQNERETTLKKGQFVRADDSASIQEKKNELKNRESNNGREKERDRERERDRDRDRDREYESASKKRKLDDSETKSSSSSRSSNQRAWLFPNLIVRVVSKSFKNGQYFTKKAKIIDVLSPTECSIKPLDDPRSGILEGKNEKRKHKNLN